MVAGIGLLPTQVKECLCVATRIRNEMRLDEAVAFDEVRVKMNFMTLKPSFSSKL